MKKVRNLYLEQGSFEWLEWRKTIITATDAPIIMGVSPYCDLNTLWQKKVGLMGEQKENSAMRRGKKMEAIAREMFIKEFKMNMTPLCIQSDKYPYLGASLDGISDCKKYLLEIKSQDIRKVKKNGISQIHYMQIQHQLLCTDGEAEVCYYVSIWKKNIYTLEIKVDYDLFDTYILEAKDFYNKVICFEEPINV